MDATTATKFESWAVVELFGHQREVGFVTTEVYGAAVLFRIDVPELPEREYELTAPEYAYSSGEYLPAGTKVKRAAVPARTRLLGAGAIYALNPCTEEVAIKQIEKLVSRPLIIVGAPNAGLLPQGADPDVVDDPYEDDEADTLP